MGVVPGDSQEVCRSSFTRESLTLFLAHPKTCVDSVTGLARHVGDQEAPLDVQAVRWPGDHWLWELCTSSLMEYQPNGKSCVCDRAHEPPSHVRIMSPV